MWPLQNADKLAAILAKAQKAKKKEIAVVGNVKAVEKNNDINCSKRGKDSDPAKKTKEMSLFQAADAEKEDEEWAEEESSLEDEVLKHMNGNTQLVFRLYCYFLPIYIMSVALGQVL